MLPEYLSKEEYASNDEDYYFYHLGQPGYKSIKTTNMISENTSNKYDHYDTVSAFHYKLTKKHILMFKKNNFTVYKKLTNVTEYVISLKENMNNIVMVKLLSTPYEHEYHDMHWKTEYKKYLKTNKDNLTDESYNLFKSRYRERLNEWVMDKYGMKLNLSPYEFLENAAKGMYSDYSNMDKYVEINLKKGSKEQYATYIPHVQLSISNPLKIYSRERIL